MLQKDKTVLVVVDVQSRLLPSIHDAEATVGQVCRLIRGFQIVGAPILVTEQYRKGLGETDPRIQEAIIEERSADGRARSFAPLEKMSFSCMLDDPFRDGDREARTTPDRSLRDRGPCLRAPDRSSPDRERFPCRGRRRCGLVALPRTATSPCGGWRPRGQGDERGDGNLRDAGVLRDRPFKAWVKLIR